MHLAIVSPPAHGHINPTLPMVEELTARGHRVSYFTHEDFRNAVESVGATLVRAINELPITPGRFDPEQMMTNMERRFDSIRAGFPRMVEHLRNDPPHAVCFDTMAFYGRILGEKLDVPSISLNPTYASNERYSFRERAMSSTQRVDSPMADAFTKMRTLITNFAEDIGATVPDHPDHFITVPVGLNIVFLPHQLQPESKTFDDRFRFVGPSLRNNANETTWRPANPDRPLLFVSLGTTFNDRPEFFRTCLDAFADSRWQVAMAVGEHVDISALAPIPENVEIRRHFPQPHVLQYADVFLSHTGMNSTMESLYHGVPLVAVPQMPEQEVTADQVAELGLGRRIEPDETDAELLRDRVEEVASNQRIRDEAAKWRTILRACPGAEGAAMAIEEYLGHTGRHDTTR